MIKVASWNLRNFSLKRNMDPIAEVLKNFNIIAIQEVRNTEAVKKLADIINYDYIVSPPQGSCLTSAKLTGKRKEMYAFLWHKSIKLIKSNIVYADEYFVRAPYMGFFKCQNFDFILCTIHVVWGKKQDRDYEVSHINKLLNEIKKNAMGENDIILCGDFNTPPQKFSLPPEWRALIHSNTVVGNKNSSIYDNFWITGSTKESSSGVYVGAGELSDHYPIYAEFKDDDQDTGVPNLDIILN